jgi:hypothetical protein
MPLNKSGSPEAFKGNVKTLMGEVGQSPHVQSRAQALAIAYSLKRRARADKHDMDVPSGSYVIPAECVSHLGENNTNAGMAKLHSVCLGSPESIRKFFSAKSPKDGGWSNVVRHMRADGGHVGSPVPIRAAGGEFVMPPNVVSIIGHGDMKSGHSTLDKWVMNRRKGHIKTLKGLAPPATD